MKGSKNKRKIVKRVLEYIIENNGGCYMIWHILSKEFLNCSNNNWSCTNYCLLYDECLVSLNTSKYEIAVNKYIDVYGKEELFKILL